MNDKEEGWSLPKLAKKMEQSFWFQKGRQWERKAAKGKGAIDLLSTPRIWYVPGTLESTGNDSPGVLVTHSFLEEASLLYVHIDLTEVVSKEEKFVLQFLKSGTTQGELGWVGKGGHFWPKKYLEQMHRRKKEYGSTV